eukprot:Rmarinus@m.2644
MTLQTTKPVDSDPRNHEVCKAKGLNVTSFENYSETSQTYDNTRQPCAYEVTLGLLANLDTPLASVHMLDIGCGTGNYMEPFVGKVGRISGLDLNIGMLEQAKAKLGDKVELHHGSMIDLSRFPENSFDAVTMNQCIHHLPCDNGFEMLGKAFKEINRVLKPNGVLVVNTSTRRQMREGFWWSALIPEGLERTLTRFVVEDFDDNTLKRLTKAANFRFGGQTIPLEATLQREKTYFDVKGPMSKVYRDGDSTWSQASDEELSQGLNRLKQMLDTGEIKQWFDEREKLRYRVGQCVFIHFFKN